MAIIDETDRVLKQRRLANKLELFVAELEPYRATLQGVAVESTFNWYWLVDGLRAKNFPAMLVNTSAIQQYEGLKRSDDQYDAWWLAHMRSTSTATSMAVRFSSFAPRSTAAPPAPWEGAPASSRPACLPGAVARVARQRLPARLLRA